MILKFLHNYYKYLVTIIIAQLSFVGFYKQKRYGLGIPILASACD